MSAVPVRIAAFVCSLAVALGAPGATKAAPPYDFTPVSAEMQRFVQTYSLDGASLRVNKAGSVVYRRAFGGYTLGTRVRIASASKWISAIAIARLVEKGRMRWTDTVGQYFPTVDASKRNITLEQLFSHTSGMAYEEDACLSSALYTLATCANRILKQPLIGQPGKVFAYGGNSMQVAGRMAEIATGKAWDDIFIDEVATPLGMTATDYSGSSTAPGYVRNTNPTIDRSVRSTLEDYGKIVDTVLAQGCLRVRIDGACASGAQYLTPATITFMARDRSIGTVSLYRPPNATGFGYGLGQWIDPSSPRLVSSTGGTGFTPWVDADRRIAGVLLVDNLNTRLYDDINDIRALINIAVADR
ncbi:MAG: beta-lactamase family protein [Xanthomonadaceae bacterium]|nr:beta-lactamase family protein [Xanthomonadaceae bacterium]